MKIAIAGGGYVGLSSAMLLAQKNKVTLFDINHKKVEMLNNNISPLDDKDIKKFLKKNSDNFLATTNKKIAYLNADYVIIATPTDYDETIDYLDTSSVESVISDVTNINQEAVIIIKSTIPVGFTSRIRKKYNSDSIIFSPEFLREGRALFDNLYPSRIIIGENSNRARIFAKLLCDGALKNNIDVLYTGSSEAEAIKLFSNSFLAMRVSFFNELDSYSEVNCFSARDIIKGVCLDPRIGDYYNNPSFGYGGYCLPKDTKQLKANFKDIPNSIINAIVDSNFNRKEFIANSIQKQRKGVVGFYRLVMKNGSDNFRSSSMLGVLGRLKEKGIKVVIYEPQIKENLFLDTPIIKNINEFKDTCDLIIANRLADEIKEIKHKVYTRDLFNSD
jgi:UDPglucose 6-dehydrogenase